MGETYFQESDQWIGVKKYVHESGLHILWVKHIFRNLVLDFGLLDWCQETLGHLSQGTGWYLASWSCLCSAVLGHGGGRGGVASTALHKHDQLAKYHPVPWLRWPNVSWHQVFCYWGYLRWVLGFKMGSWIHDRFLDSRWVHKESLRTLRSP